MYPDKENDDAYNRMQFSYKTKLRKKTVLRYDVSFKQYTRGRRCVILCLCYVVSQTHSRSHSLS